ncbi:MAG: cofactor-independent phosphoglycerate mutase [Hadesarchaea archaeon]|nr:MAG: cofactor-independent phosphoglycerate mutase [Hadesarchaea archaeon]TDA34756.1 MAG: cofactor-independent phosphoglycerate mutase [Hadesarchaea archaeon]
MKYVVVVGDGMADHPVRKLGGKTPLEVAHKPNLDSLCRRGRMGMLKTVPNGMPPGSDVANLSILGYRPETCYTGRGPLEAADLGVKLGPNDVAFRCNLITEREGRMYDYSAGHVSTEEAAELLKELGRRFRMGEFHVGITYRHVFVLRNCDPKLETDPPHEIPGEPISQHLIRPPGDPLAKKLNRMMLESKKILSGHPVNLAREMQGKNPANMIWLWSQGGRPRLQGFKRKYGLRAALISAVPLIRGIGIYTNMTVIRVPGATGYFDTNYEGKALYALRALETHDFVYVHVEAPDEAGHEGNLEMKIKAIEDLDRRLLGPLLNGLPEDCRIAILPDHPTPIEVKTHVAEPVPFLIHGPGLKGDGMDFCEKSGSRGSFGFLEGEQFLKSFLV